MPAPKADCEAFDSPAELQTPQAERTRALLHWRCGVSVPNTERLDATLSVLRKERRVWAKAMLSVNAALVFCVRSPLLRNVVGITAYPVGAGASNHDGFRSRFNAEFIIPRVR